MPPVTEKWKLCGLAHGEYKSRGGTNMRIVEKLLYGIGGLLALYLLFIAFCHYNPNVGTGNRRNIQSGGNAPLKPWQSETKANISRKYSASQLRKRPRELSIGPVPRDPIW